MKMTMLMAAGLAAFATVATSATPAFAATDEKSQSTQATVNITASADDNQLRLDSAPSFTFEEASVSDVYAGFDRDITSTGALQITDTRAADQTEGWQLDTKLSKFAEGSDQLNAATVNLTTTATAPSFTFGKKLVTDETTAKLGESADQRGTLTLKAGDIKAALHQDATPTAKAKSGSVYTAKLTWTLATAIKPAQAL